MLAIIPARGGSKGIPLKNLQPVGTHTLLARAIRASQASPLVGEVLVSTDCDPISLEALDHGALVVQRSAELSNDTARSEDALLDALEQYVRSGHAQPDIVVFVQCTSPFIDPQSITRAIERIWSDEADVVFSAIEDHTFRWTQTPDGTASAVGHSAAYRPRRQDLPPTYRETGAFYALRTSGFLAQRNRFFGRIALEPVALLESFEVDTHEDLSLCRALEEHWNAPGLLPEPPLSQAALGQESPKEPGNQYAELDVDALVTDFDGVHTNDTAILSVDGSEHVQVSRSDGMGVAQLRRTRVPLLIMSTETHPIVGARAKKLGVDVLQGISNKAEALTAWMSANRLDPLRVAYVGNDINDLPAMRLVGWPIAVADARDEVAQASRIVLSHKGGQGAVREVCDMVLAAHKARTKKLDTI